ncbi:TRAP transporter small permease [Streptosporangium sp. NBC_01810]|uniref:TRAP transporter small permease subunit n=1 Tax=Streptosporangium sp. NBC_01810 TaxID=2975951 RepID=UPI002DDC269C|nr:TRAP transporter small permease [Streptosporangium sp. NBC_01810]WSA24733.1 TRAP transporter small permease [Streptosporangium sp. NBC_01810]
MLRTSIEALNRIMGWIAFAAAVLLMVITVVGVASRWVGLPLLGVDELIAHTMVVLIAFSLAYTQSKRSHISVDLIVERLPARVQAVFNAVGSLLITGMAFTIAWIYAQENLVKDGSASISTGLLNIPALPFKVVLALGFASWSLTALVQLLDLRAVPAHGAERGPDADVEASH